MVFVTFLILDRFIFVKFGNGIHLVILRVITLGAYIRCPLKSYLKLIGFVLFLSAAFSREILLFPRRFTLSPLILVFILNRILLYLYNPLVFVRFLLFRRVLTGPILAVLAITERVPSEWLKLFKLNVLEM